MFEQIEALSNPSVWIAIAILLFVAEAVISGAVLIFLGFGCVAAAAVALGTDNTFIQIGVFALTSSVSAIYLRHIFKRDINNPAVSSDGLEVNKPEQMYVGRTSTLSSAIEGGQGRVKAGDGTWRCTGPDMPEGAKVIIVSYSGGAMVVEPHP